MKLHRHERYEWLEPPPFVRCANIADIVQEPTPEARTQTAQTYIDEVWTLWQGEHLATLAHWYEKYVT